MKFFKFWGKGSAQVEVDGRRWDVSCYGTSNTSLEEALENAAEIARRTAEAIRTGRPPAAYAYSDRPLREEIVERLSGDGGDVCVITRNSYGSLVLNAASALFADIDYPEPSFKAQLRHFVSKIAGKSAPAPADTEIVSRIHAVTERRRGLGMRLYRTANGYRSLVTSQPYDPASAEARRLLEELGSDPLYRKLCRVQECFRARLSPKFWRCDAPRPPFRFPWSTPEREREYRDWETRYGRRAGSYATCAFVASFGSAAVHPAIERVLALHDRVACHDGAPLA